MIRLSVAAAALIAFSPVAQAAGPEFLNPVRLAVFNTPDADFITYIYGGVLEQAGYNVDYVHTDYAAHFTALEFGDIDAAPAVWASVKELMDAAIASGEVKSLGSVGVGIRETWWYPNYVAELCPGLPDWTALLAPACVAALSTPESNGKINYLGTPPDWTPRDEERIAALGLEVNITPPGTLASMIASMQGAVERKTPIIGFGFAPHWLYGSDQGAFVDFPVFDQACIDDASWGVNKDAIGDCALATGDVVKLVNVGFAGRAPYAAQILSNMQIDTEAVGSGVSRQERDGLTPEDAAAEWIDAHTAQWQGWIE